MSDADPGDLATKTMGSFNSSPILNINFPILFNERGPIEIDRIQIIIVTSWIGGSNIFDVKKTVLESALLHRLDSGQDTPWDSSCNAPAVWTAKLSHPVEKADADFCSCLLMVEGPGF